jgi:lipopolysaccharide/colanic/teichoic acid biosynthesis glycosyltransferase
MTALGAGATVRGDAPYPGKRAVDLAVVAVVTIPALAIGAVCAVLVRCSSKGPVLFRQERVGREGRPFMLLKFRTMRPVTDDRGLFDDRRITAVGRVLRACSLDELPQLVNVVKGEMSVVGPRPTLAYQVERYTPEQRRRLAVRPGLTGLSQIRVRGGRPWAETIPHDVEYVERQSAVLDLSIILHTLPAMLNRGNQRPADDPLAAHEASPRYRPAETGEPEAATGA